MHELSIATELLRLCRERLAAGQRLRSVRIVIGELASLEPDLLRFAWQAVTSGSVDDAAMLEVTWSPARQSCASCGDVAERQPGTWLRLCPGCGQPLHVRGGDELDLIGVCAEPASPAVPVPPTLEVSP